MNSYKTTFDVFAPATRDHPARFIKTIEIDVYDEGGEVYVTPESSILIDKIRAEAMDKCGCRECNPKAWWMILCPDCGNKRCPKATSHQYACTNSNEPGQPGSAY